MPKAFLFFLWLHSFAAIFIVELNTAGGKLWEQILITETAITSRVDVSSAGLEGVLPGNSSDMLICRGTETIASNRSFPFRILSRSFGEKSIFLRSCETKSGTESLGSRLRKRKYGNENTQRKDGNGSEKKSYFYFSCTFINTVCSSGILTHCLYKSESS